MSPAELENSNNEGVPLKEIVLKIQEWFRYLGSKWLIILSIALATGVLGLIYAFVKKPTYKASLSFALEDDKANGGLNAAAGLASQFGFDLGGTNGAFSGDNLLELMRSRLIVEKTLLTNINVKGNQETLAELYLSFKGIREKWRNNAKLNTIRFLPNADRSKFTLQQDSVLGVLYKQITENELIVDKVDKKLSIITVEVNSGNEAFSKYFTENLLKIVSEFYIETKTKRSSENVRVLQWQTDSVRRQLNAAISGVASSADVNPNANPLLQTLKVPSQRRQVDVQANTAILTEMVKNLEISKVALRKETPLIQIIDKPILPLEKTQLGRVKAFLIGFIMGGFVATLVIFIKKTYRNIIM